MLEAALVSMIVLAGAAYLVWGFIRAARGDAGACGKGCGCDKQGGRREADLGKRHDLISINVKPTDSPV